jgi:hypothetical protein
MMAETMKHKAMLLNKNLRSLGFSTKANRSWEDERRIDKMYTSLVSTFDGTSYSNRQNLDRIDEIMFNEYDIDFTSDNHEDLHTMVSITNLFVHMLQDDRYTPHMNSLPLRNMDGDEIIQFIQNHMESEFLIEIGLEEISYHGGNVWMVDSKKAIKIVNGLIEDMLSIMNTYPMNLDIQRAGCGALLSMLSNRKTSTFHVVQSGKVKRFINKVRKNHDNFEINKVTNQVKNII